MAAYDCSITHPCKFTSINCLQPYHCFLGSRSIVDHYISILSRLALRVGLFPPFFSHYTEVKLLKCKPFPIIICLLYIIAFLWLSLRCFLLLGGDPDPNLESLPLGYVACALYFSPITVLIHCGGCSGYLTIYAFVP